MTKNNHPVTPNKHQPVKEKETDPEGYPLYPAQEDIYIKSEDEAMIDPENISTLKEKVEYEDFENANEKDFNDDQSGDDLDVPGSETDDEQEKNGSEDEENNYYSIGGDDHNDLEEDKGE